MSIIDRKAAQAAAAAVAGLELPTIYHERSVAFSSNRTGTPRNPVTLEPARSGKLLTVSVPTVQQPEPIRMAGFSPAGITPDGRAILRNTAGSELRLTSDGGVTWESVLGNGSIPTNIFFDSAGNAYGTTGGGIWRAVAGGWDFVECFKFAKAGSNVAVFGYTTDSNGGIYAAEYNLVEAEKGLLVYRSLDFGVTWASTEVDVGQLHHHSIYFHEPTQALYLMTGEPAGGVAANGRKLMKSVDRGATFTLCYDFYTNSELSTFAPTSMAPLGKNIVMGIDGGGTAGLVVFNPLRDTDAPRLIEARTENYSTTADGFLYKLLVGDNGSVFGSAEYQAAGTSVRSIYVWRRPDEIICVLAALNTRHLTHATIAGPDRNGYVYLSPSGVDALGAMVVKLPEIVDRTGYATVGNSGIAGSASWAGATTIAAGLSCSSVGVLLCSTSPIGQTSARIPVVAGRSYRIAWAVRVGTGVTLNSTYFRAEWFNGAGSSISPADFVCDIAKARSGYYLLVSKAIVAPATAASIKLHTFNTSGNAHYVVASATVHDVTGSSLMSWQPDATASESLSAEVNLSDGGVFVDRVHTNIPPSLWPVDVDIPMLSVGAVTVGLLRKSTAGMGEFHVYVDGATRSEFMCPIWGSVVIPGRYALVPRVAEGNNCTTITTQTPPLTVGISAGKVRIVNTETLVMHEADAALSGSATVTLKGTAIHVPQYFTGVADADVSQLMRGFLQ